MLNKYIIFLCLCSVVYCQNSPVFLWGSSSTPFKPALKSLNAKDFGEIISPQLTDSMLLVFLEDNLETQDISQCKLKSGETCFSNLKTFQIKTFYADVEDPVTTLKTLAKNDKIEYVKFNNNDELSSEIEFQAGKIIFITLPEKLAERSEVLIEHDSVMATVYKNIESQGKIFAMYTSKETSDSKHRIRRATTTAKTLTGKSDDGKSFVMVHLERVMLKKGSDKVIDIEIGSIELNKKMNKNIEEFRVIMKGADKKDFSFIISKTKGYWGFNTIAMGEENFMLKIESAVGFSYYCGNTVAASKESTLMIPNFQIEIYDDKEPTKFSDPWHCVGFISGGIISGLFVSFMFIIIMSIGICWLMDIRTMDRFDDPKGKTITINVSE